MCVYILKMWYNDIAEARLKRLRDGVYIRIDLSERCLNPEWHMVGSRKNRHSGLAMIK